MNYYVTTSIYFSRYIVAWDYESPSDIKILHILKKLDENDYHDRKVEMPNLDIFSMRLHALERLIAFSDEKLAVDNNITFF